MEWTLFEKIIFILFCLLGFIFLAHSITTNRKVQDKVDDDADSLYCERDVIGQLKPGLGGNSKNDIPIAGQPTILLMIALIFMIVALVFHTDWV